jgi:hypothetical protein
MDFGAWHLPTSLHDTKTQNIILTAVKILNLTLAQLFLGQELPGRI